MSSEIPVGVFYLTPLTIFGYRLPATGYRLPATGYRLPAFQRNTPSKPGTGFNVLRESISKERDFFSSGTACSFPSSV